MRTNPTQNNQIARSERPAQSRVSDCLAASNSAQCIPSVNNQLNPLFSPASKHNTYFGRYYDIQAWFEDQFIPEPNSGCWLWS